MTYQATLGRIKLPTINSDIVEALGDTLDSIGATVVPGELRSRPFNPTIPVHGDLQDVDPYASGLRLRRQLRSLMQNNDARRSGIYFKFNYDTELNSWLQIGGTELAWADGGISLAEFELRLTECFDIGNFRTHKTGIRVAWVDLRDSSVPADYLKTEYNTGFASVFTVGTPPPNRVWLPFGASNVTGLGRLGLTSAYTIASLYGTMNAYESNDFSEVVAYDISETDMFKTDVVVWDRAGQSATPTFTLAGDQDPQAVYGWEEVYGTDYPVTVGDVPMVGNSICRVRWSAADGRFIIDAWEGSGALTEQGRLWVGTAVTGTVTLCTTLLSATVQEWTRERAVIRAVLANGVLRCEVFITLQRGWAGPRFEVYGTNAAGATGTAVRYVPVTSGATTLTPATGGMPHTVGGSEEPWLRLLPQTRYLNVHSFVQPGLALSALADTTTYGSTRNGVQILADSGTAEQGYVSTWLGYYPRANTGESTTQARAGLFPVLPVAELVGR